MRRLKAAPSIDHQFGRRLALEVSFMVSRVFAKKPNTMPGSSVSIVFPIASSAGLNDQRFYQKGD